MFRTWGIHDVITRQSVENALGGGGGTPTGGNTLPSGGSGSVPGAGAGVGAGGAGGTNGAGAGDGAGGGANNQPTTITIDYAKLPDPMKELFTAKGWTPGKEGVGEVIANSYYHANKALSGAADVIVMPGDNATPEQRAAFNQKLGVPANAEGYTSAFKQLEGKEGVNPDFVGWAKNTFLETGVPAKAAEKIIANWQTFVGEQVAKEQTNLAKDNEAKVVALKQSFGADWDRISAAGLNVVKSIGLSPEANDYFAKNGGVAAVAELMAKLGKRIGTEGGFVQEQGGGGPPTDPSQMTSAQADEAIKTLQGNADFQKAYQDAKHPEHKAAVERMEKLYAAKARRA